jgi:membrane-associated phospholipid phosphatase
VSAGRPPWWLVAASALVTGAVSVELLAGAWLGRVDGRVSAVVGGWDLRHGAAYPLFWLASQLGGRVTILVVIAGLVGHLAWRRHAVLPLLRVLLALALLTATVYAFKLGMGRTAPAYPGSYFHRGGESFPSGHVANAVLMWGVARWQAVQYALVPPAQRLFGWLSIGGPIVAGAAMLVLDFHWLTDVVVGAAVGIVLLGVVHGLDAVLLSRWVRARAGRASV